ncbi:MAG TPA: hypothetical protein VFV38_24345 [Ktedonobacteraceae bacterium]|nr:hypothetical protein [Ktedonobacteraceae bacterium]
MMVPSVRKLPTSLHIGKSTLRLDKDETTTLAFIDGVQAGILNYEVHGKKARLYDTDLILLIAKQQNNASGFPLSHAGFVVGMISTLTQKGTYQFTHKSFRDGHHEGLQAYCLLGRHYAFTLSDMSKLLAYKHQDQDSAFNAGYIIGFIQGLTEGLQAVIRLVGGNR